MQYVGNGPWGTGLTRPLTGFEGSSNWYELDQRLAGIEALSLSSGVGIDDITQTGNVVTFHLSDTTTHEVILPEVMFSFLEGGWQPLTVMTAGMIFIQDGALYMVNANHTTAATFDANANNGAGVYYYKQMFPTPSIGKQTIWVPAGAMIPQSTNGPGANLYETVTNKNIYKVLEFDNATQQFAQFSVGMPKAWNKSTITFQPYWRHPSTTVDFGVVFGLDAVAVSSGDAFDVAFGTAQTSTNTGGDDTKLYIGAESAAIVIAGSISTGDLVNFRIHRDPANVADTLGVVAQLVGVKLFYRTNAVNDD